MEQVIAMCTDGMQYPLNLPPRKFLSHVLSSYWQQLDEHQDRLFSLEQYSEVVIRDFDDGGDGVFRQV